MPDAARAYADYLLGTDPDGLAPTLRAAGYVGLAKLLDSPPGARYSVLGGAWPSVWDGRRCVLGRTPPTDAAPWSLWFDPVEVAVMTLVPRPVAVWASWPPEVQRRKTPNVGWLSLIPAGRWQVGGWARAVGAVVDLEPGAQLDPATGLSGQQAQQYARYFGKSMAGRFGWTAVYEVGDPLASAVWPPNAGPELAGYVGEGEVLVLTRERALVPDDPHDDDPHDDDPHHDPDHDGDDEQDAVPGGDRVPDVEPLPAVTFRTAVTSQLPFRPEPPSPA